MVNEFLQNEQLPTITEMRTKEGKKDILGIVTTDYKIILQTMVKKYIVEHKIETQNNHQKKSSILGILSSEEKKIVDILLEEYMQRQQNIESEKTR